MKYASKSTRGFYTPEIHGENMPADVVGITDEQHAALIDGQSAGKVIDWDSGDVPVLADPPAPDMATIRRAEIMARLAQIDLDTMRPLRAVLVGSATQYDHDKLAMLDAEAAILRSELVEL